MKNPANGGDDDYRLVLTDNTRRYTDEHAKPPVPPTFHSFVGELPNPNCLSGAHRQFGNRSRYLLPVAETPFNMATARRVFEAEFPDARLQRWLESHQGSLGRHHWRVVF